MSNNRPESNETSRNLSTPYVAISNASPITDITFEIKDINVIIGEQASGKSSICKALLIYNAIKLKIIETLYEIGSDDVAVSMAEAKDKVEKALSCKSNFIH